MTKQFSPQSAPAKPPKLNPDFHPRLPILSDEATQTGADNGKEGA
jgi:hypothetical protein